MNLDALERRLVLGPMTLWKTLAAEHWQQLGKEAVKWGNLSNTAPTVGSAKHLLEALVPSRHPHFPSSLVSEAWFCFVCNDNRPIKILP